MIQRGRPISRRNGKEGSVGYSPTEGKLLSILLKQKKPISSLRLCELLYDEEERPWHAQGGVISAMRSLCRKVEHNREDFTIERSERRGPHPIEFQVVGSSGKRKVG